MGENRSGVGGGPIREPRSPMAMREMELGRPGSSVSGGSGALLATARGRDLSQRYRLSECDLYASSYTLLVDRFLGIAQIDLFI